VCAIAKYLTMVNPPLMIRASGLMDETPLTACTNGLSRLTGNCQDWMVMMMKMMIFMATLINAVLHPTNDPPIPHPHIIMVVVEMVMEEEVVVMMVKGEEPPQTQKGGPRLKAIAIG
jgi:hypothetical protein